MLICAALLLAGMVAGGVWSRLEFQRPDPELDLTASVVAKRFAWYVALAMTAGIVAGITVIGAGGRLAMRLLAVTAGDNAQGRLTEADEIVGEITVDGTIGFVIFNGVIGGIVGGALYLLVRRFLPPRWPGGITFGVALLVVFGTTLDPLRADNPDFDIVGPGWLALLVFASLAIAFGVVMSGLMAAVSRWLPLLAADRRVLLRYLAPAVLAAVAFSVTAVAVVIGVVAIVLTRWQPIVDAVRSRRWVLAGRMLGVVALLLAIPNAVSTFVDIGTRS